MTTHDPTFLITDAAYFDVSYTINPWMTPKAWQENEAQNKQAALTASKTLVRALRDAGANILTLEGKPGLPDMVFPANAAIVLDNHALLSRFRYPERQGEEAHFRDAFDDLHRQGLMKSVRTFPDGCWQEGAGDCIWDHTRQIFWAGFGPRSKQSAIAVVEETFGVSAIDLELISDRFYHLDVCFLPLSGGEIVYYPHAFSEKTITKIKDCISPHLLIEASIEDATRFSVNAINIGKTVIMATPSDRLRGQLSDRGYHVDTVDLAPFMMSGGAAYCMTLRLDRTSQAKQANHDAQSADHMVTS